MDYRREIDGLRALAVLPVILFHAGFETLSGGFVGVDVFFVISGYLITTIILAEIEQGKFSIVNFYERRARRILPALFVVMLVCLPFAWLWLLPSDMKLFVKSIVAVSLFSSNILFWSESGYFDTAAELKPLLHTWSLSVEEQFYVLFPVLLIIAWRFGRRRVLGLLAVVAVLSLAAAQWGSTAEPAATFFLLPTRGWELLIGAFVAYYLQAKTTWQPSRMLREACSTVGLAMLAYAVFAFNKQTPFPSLYTLVPTVGTALIILFATQQTTVGKLIGNKVLVGIGLISYSAYLWHQPVFAFVRYRSLEEPSKLLLSALVVGSVVLAYFSWKYVETPFRLKRLFSPKQVFSFGAVVSVAFLLFGLAGYATDGFEKYIEIKASIASIKVIKLIDEANKKSSVYTIGNRVDNGDCIFNVENITKDIYLRLVSCRKKYGQGIGLIGDSHATNLFNSIYAGNRNRLKFFVGVTKNGCNLPTTKKECQYDEFLRFVSENPAVFSGFLYEKAGWLMLRKDSGYVHPYVLQKLGLGDKFSEMYPDIDTISGVINYLKRLAVFSPVVWFGPRVEPQISKNTAYRLGCDYEFKLRDNQYSTYTNLDMVLRNTVSEIDGLEYISQIDAYKFDFPNDFMTCDGIYWIDGHHFSPLGEVVFGSRYDLVGHLLTEKIAKPPL